MPNALISLLRSFAAQAVAIATLLAVWKSAEPSLEAPLALTLALSVSGSCAGVLSWLLGLTLPWRILNAIFPLALFSLLVFSVSHWIFALAGITIFALYLPALFSQVPFFPTSSATVEKLLEFLPDNTEFLFVDLGCGFGEPLFSLAKRRPMAQFVGLDLSPFSVALAWTRSLFFRNARIKFANLWTHPLTQYDYVYAFLAPPPMARLGAKARSEMKREALLISNTFEIPGATGREVSVNDPTQNTLYIYQWDPGVQLDSDAMQNAQSSR